MKSTRSLSGVGFVVSCLVVGVAFGASGPEQTAVDIAYQYVERNQQKLGLAGSDIREMAVSSQVTSEHNGVTHVYLQQRYRGIDVYNGIVNVNVLYGRDVLSAGNRFVSRVAAAAGAQNARQTALQATRAAAGHLELGAKKPFVVLDTLGGESRRTTLSDGGVAARPIEAKLVWYPVDGAVRLAWSLEIEEAVGTHWWMAFVDATTGALLGKEDLMIQHSVAATAGTTRRAPDQASAAGPFRAADGATYNVFPMPLENPNDGGRQLVTDPAELIASPFGWHDTNGADGAEFTVTRGNNVHAYTDVDANNQPDPGSDPDGGPSLFFDPPLDLSQPPATYRPAAVVNLFYWNNIMHDVTYGYGFTEAAGNFQVNTYGRGGVGNDDVRAEAQDGSGVNNANFGTGVDGVRPRMQMFRWTDPFGQLATVNSPPAIAGVYLANPSNNGGTANGLTADLMIVDDGVPPTTDACNPIVNDLTGKIALLVWNPGVCNSSVFVANAANAGAVAAIIVDNTPQPYTNFGGSGLIPSVAVGSTDGQLFISTITGGATVNVTIDNNPDANDRDSDFDAGVIAHEYGHGISNRLTGGPAVVNCLNNAEQMGEGWSDWFGMTLTADAADNGLTPRGVGTYVNFQDPLGVGIRNTQYTTDMSINPSTYAWVADTINVSQPHGIGYVWNTMLWEVYWNLVDRHGFNTNFYGSWSTGGNNLALQLVMDGMKLQVCRPGFVDGRNAILLADVALTGGANQCEIWRGFAKRGLGLSASQGLATSRVDGVEAFDLPAECTSAVFGGFFSPVSGPPAVNSVNAGRTIPVKFALSGVDGLPPVDQQQVDCATLQTTGGVPQPPATPGSTVLTRKGDLFQVNWKTDASWAGTCRKITVRIPAASDAVAFFNFF